MQVKVSGGEYNKPSSLTGHTHTALPRAAWKERWSLVWATALNGRSLIEESVLSCLPLSLYMLALRYVFVLSIYDSWRLSHGYSRTKKILQGWGKMDGNCKIGWYERSAPQGGGEVRKGRAEPPPTQPRTVEIQDPTQPCMYVSINISS